MENKSKIINWKKVLQFLALAFGIAWASEGVMKLFGNEFSSGIISTMFVSVFVMGAPAMAAFIVQKFFWKGQGTFADFGWRWKGTNWKWIFIFTPLIFVLYFSAYISSIAGFGNGLHIAAFGWLDFSNDHFIAQTRDEYGLDKINGFLLLIYFRT